jgi:hypothetical protein
MMLLPGSFFSRATASATSSPTGAYLGDRLSAMI